MAQALLRLVYRGTSLIRNRLLLGPCGRAMLRDLWWAQEGGEVLLYHNSSLTPSVFGDAQGFLSHEESHTLYDHRRAFDIGLL